MTTESTPKVLVFYSHDGANAQPMLSPGPQRTSPGLLGGIMLMSIVMAFCSMVGVTARAQAPTSTSVQQSADGLIIRTASGAVNVQVWADNIVRVRRYRSNAPDLPSLAVNMPRPSQQTVHFVETPTSVELSTPAIKVAVSRESSAVSFNDAAGKPYLGEILQPGNDGLTPSVERGPGLFAVRQAFDISSSQEFLGLGQHSDGAVSRNGRRLLLQQVNSDVAVPMLWSTRGYGIMWDNPAVTSVEVGVPQASHQLVFQSETARDIDYYFIAGTDPDAVIAGYRRLTGAAPMMARWTWGFWQSRERYASQGELVGVARRYREMNIPLDGVIQDWQYWASGQWGSHQFDSERYPDPKAMIADLRAMNVHAIISVWPRFDVDLDNAKALDAAGALLVPTFRNVYPAGFGRWYDPFDKANRDRYWSQVSKTMTPIGWDGYWLDGSEAELGGAWGELRALTTSAGSGAEVYNAYPLMHTTGVFEGQAKDAPGKRPFILTRSAWLGQQRNAAVVWSGDIHGDWEVFRKQIPAGLNFVASGIPYWNTDIGGFFGGEPTDANYRELFVRWFQFGAFTPMFRVHGTGPAKEIWRFDEEAQQILKRYVELRYRLLPYIYATSWQVTVNGYTMMRPLEMDFTSDPQARSLPDQYMFGPSLLINPVTQAKAGTRTVYLPGQSAWYDFWTGHRYAGGSVVTVATPLDLLPIYARAGAIVPMGPVVSHAEEGANAALEIRVYRGADGAFTLYDDEGDGQGYQKGRRATIDLRWDEAQHSLTIGARRGRYPGMPRERIFNIVWVGEQSGAGLAAGPPDQVVRYTGQETVVISTSPIQAIAK
ncbi:TIM-barrel domain-containing protein [Pseudoxanthomonas sp. CF125]|uniref:glycoside hydrolase family 31 protein n=1 Tax=Pseudoxanthomonas sp. CF125 TaxID=1855303 RepID=UPI00088098F9|nr:TIM-barrel domain-containing protein [Pseudoxanthomonas sp. CF125]SDQ81064.1 alpha-D-xyloside xylohydrolase [Pseudoxanthomonas sp. CF125]